MVCLIEKRVELAVSNMSGAAASSLEGFVTRQGETNAQI
jgi:hypothetical protein